jgi:hypothetical protein
MKAAVIGMVNNVGNSVSHHGGGYYHVMLNILKNCQPFELDINPNPSSWNDYERIYILEGVNYQENAFNFIGGPQPEHRQKLEAIANYKGLIINVNVPLDLNIFNNRFKLQHKFSFNNTIDYARMYGIDTRKLVRGDSHSLSVWKPGFGLDRTDGKTLYGFLKDSDSIVQDWNKKYDETITYFSNIDIRFHLMRQSNPEQATKNLFTQYIKFSSKLNNNTIVEPLPIEHESRKLPGTGLYKGQKYFGTREERMHLRQIAIDLIRESGQKYLSWPEQWHHDDGTKMLSILEPKQSVHLKPKYYLYFNEIISQ